MAAATSVHVVAIVEPIIQHADWFFPEGMTFIIVKMYFPYVLIQDLLYTRGAQFLQSI